LLNGDLGAGKTTFAKGFARQLGINDNITSPTFAILNEYNIASGAIDIKKLIHIDAYRLDGVDYTEIG